MVAKMLSHFGFQKSKSKLEIASYSTDLGMGIFSAGRLWN